MTVVIDCNVLVMCLSSHSRYHVIYKSLIHGKFNLPVTVDIMLEYEEIIQQKYSTKAAHSLISLLTELPNVHHVRSSYKWQLITADPDDDKYCDCAIAGQANYIVTEDRHFDVLKTISFPSIAVISSDTFLEMLKSI
jgi:uncharacterized protein